MFNKKFQSNKKSGVAGPRPPPSQRQRANRDRMTEFNSGVAERAGTSQSWSHQAQIPDESTPFAGGRRSRGKPRFKSKGKNQSPTATKVLNTVATGSSETPPRNEPLYDLPDMINLIPVNRFNPLPVEHSGYVTLCEQCYKHLISQDSRLSRQLTESTFLHVMVEYLWVRLFRLKTLFGEELTFNEQQIWDAVAAREVYLPQAIHEYLKNIGEFTDGYGLRWRPYLPSDCIPRNDTTTNVARPGCFGDGTISAENHNAYECFPAPYVFKTRLELEYAARTRTAFANPLPVMPEGLLPTANLLGYTDALEPWHQQAKSLMPFIYFDNEHGRRIMHCPPACNTVQGVLDTLKDKIKIVQGIPENREGSLAQIATTTRNRGYVEDILRINDVGIRSPTKLTPSEIGMACLFTYTRKRSPDCIGSAFIRPTTTTNAQGVQTTSNANPTGWETTRNDFNEFRGLFVCNEYNDSTTYDADNFRQLSCQNRVIMVYNWILSKFTKKNN